MGNNRPKTYTEYRDSFSSVDEFRKGFGKLSKREAYALIDADNSPTYVKAAMLATWDACRKELESNPGRNGTGISESENEHRLKIGENDAEARTKDDCQDQERNVSYHAV